MSSISLQYLSCLSTQSSSSDKLAFDVGLQEIAEGKLLIEVPSSYSVSVSSYKKNLSPQNVSQNRNGKFNEKLLSVGFMGYLGGICQWELHRFNVDVSRVRLSVCGESVG